jgi:hypothetical protein
LSRAAEQDEIIALVTREWPAIMSRPANRSDAETCRQMMLALLKAARQPEAILWRTRTMIRAAEAGWDQGVAALIITDVFRLQAEANAGVEPSDPAYRAAPQALEILDELLPFIGEDGPPADQVAAPSPRFNARTYYEKRGFLLVAAKRYDEALEAYDHAKRYVEHDDRGRLKVRGGRASCLYLSSADPQTQQSAIDETATVVRESRELGHYEILRIAEQNLARMTAGQRDLLAYEVL